MSSEITKHIRQLSLGAASTVAGYVDGPSILAFAAEITQQQRADVLHSTLLAKLAADGQYSRITNASGWMGYYSDTLEKFGWKHTATSIPGTKFPPGASLERAIPEAFPSSVPLRSKALTDVLAFVKTLSDDSHSRWIFEEGAREGNAAGFQAGEVFLPDSDMPDSDLTILIGTFSLSSIPVDGPLLDVVAADAKDQFAGFTSLSLDQAMYAKVRDVVIQKLS